MFPNTGIRNEADPLKAVSCFSQEAMFFLRSATHEILQLNPFNNQESAFSGLHEVGKPLCMFRDGERMTIRPRNKFTMGVYHSRMDGHWTTGLYRTINGPRVRLDEPEGT